MTTYEDDSERRRTSVGAKVMIFALAIFAVLGAFWTIVWFIRSYVEQPRITAAIPMALAARESHPVPLPPADPPPAPPVADTSANGPPPAPAVTAAMGDPVPAPAASPAPPPDAPAAVTAQATPAPAAAPAAAPTQPPQADPAPSGPIADRWLPTTQAPAAPAPAAAPGLTARPTSAPITPAPAAESTEPPPAAAPSDDAANNEVVAVMEPAITGRVPTPRRKPPVGATAKLQPPLPRPRPDGPAPQSVWTATPVQDDRYPATSQ